MKQALLMAEFYSTPWALQPERLAAFGSMLQRWQGGAPASAGVLTRVAADRGNLAARNAEALRRQEAARVGQDANIAVLTLYGVITQRGNQVDEVSGPGSTSTQKFTAAMRAALQDPSVDAILVDIDSPGGSVYGVDELATEMIASRTIKPIYGLANSLAASAAYWIGSACSELYVTPGGEVGSIGVWMAHEDVSQAMDDAGVKVTLISGGKYKTEGNAYEPLSQEAQAFMQSRVNDYHQTFIRTVAKGRRVSTDVVRRDFGQGRVYGASQALTAGMVNGVMTLDQVVGKMGRDLKTGRHNQANRAPGAYRLAHYQRVLEIEQLSNPVATPQLDKAKRVMNRIDGDAADPTHRPARSEAALRYLDSLK